ncbi:bifunctional adenosylcobinamide kinase/adenosylcobinamide-phosphate guanylyltransferase [Iodidimonas sp. SYSU 1G8]|uniref:bifunctional adenosylcobinamide kinase/adenosylcobinamide-phosphate guanylyltransferase n=1 Tax=Iodidimonas sp. SYSU 1G8 TaxID=3133967 RepID=UPI0031FE54C7
MTDSFLILGGARSGKTRRALALADAMPSPIYLATAEARDGEMTDRIARHRAERGPHWRTVEEPLELAQVLRRETRPERALLVDCLTLWLSNLMEAGRDIEAETRRLVQALADCPGRVILVSNEVGLGLVPETPLGRAFRDAQGRLNQAVAARVSTVEFIAAGLPLRLKG